MISNRTATAALVVAAAFALAGCSGGADAPVSVADTTWGTPDTEGKPVITFTADGGLGGNDGCNVFGGNWSETQNGVEISDVFSTMMFCEGVDTWLTEANAAVVDGDTITFSDEDGKELGSLDKSEFTAPE